MHVNLDSAMGTTTVRCHDERCELRASLPPGDAGTEATLAVMAAVAIDAASTPEVRRVAATIRRRSAALRAERRERGTPNDPRPVELLVLWSWCQIHIVFRPDPLRLELVRHPADLIRKIERVGQAEADCDDLACVVVSVLIALRLPGVIPRFVVIGRRKDAPFEHVLPAADVHGELVPIDVQEGYAVGEWPPHARAAVYAVERPGGGTIVGASGS
jgi:hypothetical protein